MDESTRNPQVLMTIPRYHVGYPPIAKGRIVRNSVGTVWSGWNDR